MITLFNKIRVVRLLAALCFCAVSVALADDDPFESLNRRVLEFNDAADGAILRPVAVAYDNTVPGPIRAGLMNAYDNLSDVNGAINALIQGRPARAAKNKIVHTSEDQPFGCYILRKGVIF